MKIEIDVVLAVRFWRSVGFGQCSPAATRYPYRQLGMVKLYNQKLDDKTSTVLTCRDVLTTQRDSSHSHLWVKLTWEQFSRKETELKFSTLSQKKIVLHTRLLFDGKQCVSPSSGRDTTLLSASNFDQRRKTTCDVKRGTKKTIPFFIAYLEKKDKKETLGQAACCKTGT